LHGKNSYVLKDGVEGSNGESRSNSMNEEGNEKEITECDEEFGAKENLEQNISRKTCIFPTCLY
jgi:hypothetical protein